MAFSVEPSPVIDEPLRPRALWYWIGGALIAIGVVGAIAGFVLGFMGLDDTIDDFERVSYPEGGTITIDEPGKYVIYGEQGTSVGTQNVTAFIDLVDPDGAPVVTSQYVGSLNYDFSGRAGVAIATFSADEAGSYEFLAADAGSGNATSLAVGDSIAGDLVRAVLVPMLVGGVGFLSGAIMLIVTGVRRSRAKRRRGPPPMAPPGTWGQTPPSPGGPGGQPPAQPPTQWGAPPAGSSAPPPPPPSPGVNPPPPPGWPS